MFTYLDSYKINIITHGKYLDDSELISKSFSNDYMLFVAMKPDCSIIKQLFICKSKSITIKIYLNMMRKTVIDLIKDHIEVADDEKVELFNGKDVVNPDSLVKAINTNPLNPFESAPINKNLKIYVETRKSLYLK